MEWRLEWMGHWMSPWIWSNSTFRTIAWLSLVFSSCACILPTVSTYGWLWSTQGCELTQMKFKNHIKSINHSNLWKVSFNMAHQSTTVIWSEKVRIFTCSFTLKRTGLRGEPVASLQWKSVECWPLGSSSVCVGDKCRVSWEGGSQEGIIGLGGLGSCWGGRTLPLCVVLFSKERGRGDGYMCHSLSLMWLMWAATSGSCCLALPPRSPLWWAVSWTYELITTFPHKLLLSVYFDHSNRKQK